MDNNTPSTWPGDNQVVTINDATISGLNFTFRDDDPPAGSEVNFQVTASATFDAFNWFNDITGSGRSDMNISNAVTLRVTTLNITGRFPNHITGPGTLRFNPSGGAATYNYFGGTEQLGSNGTYNHQDVTTMNYNRSGGGAWLEGRDCTWVVGNAGADQTWNTSGGELRLILRSTGGP